MGTFVSKLEEVKASIDKVDSRRVSLVDLVYTLLGILGVRDWDYSDELLTSRLGTIARFADFVADYEVVTKHARMSTEEDARQIGAADQREWYYKTFAIHMSNYARGAYSDFDGEDDLLSDSVELMTIHAAKGLEWPIVFLPSLTSKRFPSTKNGQVKNWIVPRDKFDAARYEGTDADERRLFYVAATRAREWLSLSAHERVNKQKGSISPYLREVKDKHVDALDLPGLTPTMLMTTGYCRLPIPKLPPTFRADCLIACGIGSVSRLRSSKRLVTVRQSITLCAPSPKNEGGLDETCAPRKWTGFWQRISSYHLRDVPCPTTCASQPGNWSLPT